jgi:tetratricopeptide (TPR) repeat protein
MEDFDEQEVEELLTKFKNMINSGESNFFDSDEMELIIDELMRNFDFNNGSKAIDYAISLYPSDSFFRILKVKKLILELKLDDAEEELNEIEQMFPPTPEFYLEKVLLSRMTGEDNNTFSLLQKALKLDEEDPEIHFMLAYEYLKKRNISQALQHASFALNADESFDEQLFTYSYLSRRISNLKMQLLCSLLFRIDFRYLKVPGSGWDLLTAGSLIIIMLFNLMNLS